MKLQQAYISEAVAVGNWQIIGYKGPGDNTKGSANGGDKSGTTNFKYADAVTYANNTVALDNTERAGFVAANQAKLNDCAAKSGDASASNFNWKVTVKSLHLLKATPYSHLPLIARNLLRILPKSVANR